MYRCVKILFVEPDIKAINCKKTLHKADAAICSLTQLINIWSDMIRCYKSCNFCSDRICWLDVKMDYPLKPVYLKQNQKFYLQFWKL